MIPLTADCSTVSAIPPHSGLHVRCINETLSLPLIGYVDASFYRFPSIFMELPVKTDQTIMAWPSKYLNVTSSFIFI